MLVPVSAVKQSTIENHRSFHRGDCHWVYYWYLCMITGTKEHWLLLREAWVQFWIEIGNEHAIVSASVLVSLAAHSLYLPLHPDAVAQRCQLMEDLSILGYLRCLDVILHSELKQSPAASHRSIKLSVIWFNTNSHMVAASAKRFTKTHCRVFTVEFSLTHHNLSETRLSIGIITPEISKKNGIGTTRKK